MRVFIAVLVLIFSLQSWTKAEDIRDFQIEGMSVGDSLLMYETKENIDAEVKENRGTYKSNLYSRYSLRNINSKDYYHIQVHFKTKDKNYTISSIAGVIKYKNEFEKCKKKKKEITKDILNAFPNFRSVDHGTYSWSQDPSGKSLVSQHFFELGTKKYNDNIGISCYDWSDEISNKYNWFDNLRVSVQTKEFDHWLIEIANK